MHGHRFIRLVAGLTLAGANPVHAQGLQPLPAAHSLRLDSWQAAPPSPLFTGPADLHLDAASPNRARHALIGGAIGAAAGVVACTVISTLADDSADGGISFCPLDSYLLIGGAGFVVGAVIGWVL